MSDTTPNAPVKTRRVSVGGRSFSSRNPTTIGAIGLVLILVILWAAFNASKLPIIGGGTTYSALFSEDAGLQPSDDVRIAGVKVGTVSSTTLDGTSVKVKFKIKHAFIGNQSTVSIELKTLLGAKYLAIDSQGQTKQKASQTIPRSRTMSPFDVYPAFTELTQTVDNIHTTQLSQALGTLSSDFDSSASPQNVKDVLSGLTRLSNTVSSRDAQLKQLLSAANSVSGTLASRDAELAKLLNDGGLLLDELNARRDAIHSLLVNTATLSTQLEGLVKDNQKTLGPMLTNLHNVLTIVQNNQDSLDRGLALLAPFYRVFNNTIGNGRWFDNYICNLSATGFTSILGLGSDDGTCPAQ
jgi:phospholipid/cholesterol/gamma-HCH transport system substrate-binding protein